MSWKWCWRICWRWSLSFPIESKESFISICAGLKSKGLLSSWPSRPGGDRRLLGCPPGTRHQTCRPDSERLLTSNCPPLQSFYKENPRLQTWQRRPRWPFYLHPSTGFVSCIWVVWVSSLLCNSSNRRGKNLLCSVAFGASALRRVEVSGWEDHYRTPSKSPTGTCSVF